jgi:hypothetical protein
MKLFFAGATHAAQIRVHEQIRMTLKTLLWSGLLMWSYQQGLPFSSEDTNKPMTMMIIKA